MGSESLGEVTRLPTVPLERLGFEGSLEFISLAYAVVGGAGGTGASTQTEDLVVHPDLLALKVPSKKCDVAANNKWTPLMMMVVAMMVEEQNEDGTDSADNGRHDGCDDVDSALRNEVAHTLISSSSIDQPVAFQTAP